MKAKDLQRIIGQSFHDSQRIVAFNFEGNGLGECDIITLTNANLIYEYEVKISRSDFKADFKKRFKHEKLSGKWIDKIKSNTFNIPNYFYFACPKDLIKPEEVPEYAGLIYAWDKKYTAGVYDSSFNIKEVEKTQNYLKMVKIAPKLHNGKATDKTIRLILRRLSSICVNKLT